MIIKQLNLSAGLADLVQEYIYRGELEAGERINEVHLAAKMGVSRTPLREALQRLVALDVLEAIPRRGFFVKELTRLDFENIYPIRAILDPAALESSGMPSAVQIERLESINDDLIRESDPVTAIEIDNIWHFELLSRCRNTVLLDLIRQFVRRSRRYELAYFLEAGGIATATNEHSQIISALQDGNLEDGCSLLRKNLTSGTEPIIAWLDGRNQEEK